MLVYIKIFETIMDYPIRNIPNRADQEPVWLGHEKWFGISGRLKNFILD